MQELRVIPCCLPVLPAPASNPPKTPGCSWAGGLQPPSPHPMAASDSLSVSFTLTPAPKHPESSSSAWGSRAPRAASTCCGSTLSLLCCCHGLSAGGCWVPKTSPPYSAVGSAPPPPSCAASWGPRSVLGGTVPPDTIKQSNKSLSMQLLPCHGRALLSIPASFPALVSPGPAAVTGRDSASSPLPTIPAAPRGDSLMSPLLWSLWGAPWGCTAHLTPRWGQRWLLLVPCSWSCFLGASVSSSSSTPGWGRLGEGHQPKLQGQELWSQCPTMGQCW